ncbi:DUF1294 domain-containing protein [Qipengyuania sp. JC766]|uniref:DUF1294 domain-containing protein n=1 Tax=Qipengyuania sp. JC766 TaxID=3232139 RepID=UPI00345A8945
MLEFALAMLALYLAVINLIAFSMFGFDKMRAVAGASRTPEVELLSVAALGGTAGAYAGRALFRHKTRKQPFSGRLHTIAILQVAAAAGLLVFLAP